MAYILTPLLFSVLGYGTLFAAASPWLGQAGSIVRLITLNQPYQFNQTVTNIFSASNADSGTVSIEDITFPSDDTIFGRFVIDSVGINYPLVFGDDRVALKKGAGQYMGSYIPGYGGTVLIAGHNYMFRDIGDIRKGAVIRVSTSYGNYRYRVTDIRIIDKNTQNAYTIQKGKEQLVFYTCYPFNALGSINTRFFVYADYVSGPKIIT